ALYRKGKQTPKMMTVALHCRLAGKPARAAAFARFIDHILRHDRVWICRRNEIAEHWRCQHPAIEENRSANLLSLGACNYWRPGSHSSAIWAHAWWIIGRAGLTSAADGKK